MAFGFYCINDSGSVQIDQDYFNLTLSATATLTSTSDSSMGFEANRDTAYVYFPLLYTGNYPLVAVRPASGQSIGSLYGLNQPYYDYDGNDTNHGLVWFMTGTTSRSVDYFVFDSLSVSPSGMGMKVNNSGGQTVFFSGQPLMRGVSLITLDASVSSATYSVDSSRSYAFVFLRPHSGVYTAGGSYPGSRFKTTVASISGGTLTVSQTNFWNNSGVSVSSNETSQLLLVDVTDL